jgi:hypothetical protein
MTLDRGDAFFTGRVDLVDDWQHRPAVAERLHALVVPGPLQGDDVPPHGVMDGARIALDDFRWRRGRHLLHLCDAIRWRS